MGVEVHQGRVAREIIIGGINTKMGIGDGGARHIQRIDNLLKIRRRAIRGDLICENGEGIDEGKKSKTHCIFNQEGPTDHMINH